AVGREPAQADLLQSFEQLAIFLQLLELIAQLLQLSLGGGVQRCRVMLEKHLGEADLGKGLHQGDLVRRRGGVQGLQLLTQGSRLVQGGADLPFEGRVFLGLLSSANAAEGEQSSQDKAARDAVAHGGFLEATGAVGLAVWSTRSGKRWRTSFWAEGQQET